MRPTSTDERERERTMGVLGSLCILLKSIPMGPQGPNQSISKLNLQREIDIEREIDR